MHKTDLPSNCAEYEQSASGFWLVSKIPKLENTNKTKIQVNQVKGMFYVLIKQLNILARNELAQR
jgi:hypothetical protein